MLVYLTPNDFFVNDKNQLVTRLQGFSFLMFTSTQCPHCKFVEPAFTRLSSLIQGCTFALVDVDQDNRQIIKKALHTSNKIEYVPYIVLCLNGVEKMQFKPIESQNDQPVDDVIAMNIKAMRTFLVEQTSHIRSEAPTKQTVSTHSIGMPVNSKKVCYMQYSSAYTK